uniref:Uncharacterized protein n=1 Tax=Daphnia galeata TaxID=27404 RepID=A0A8J2RLH4_9CRUS|nr:unnamed protein product [Daphnia galeata]
MECHLLFTLLVSLVIFIGVEAQKTTTSTFTFTQTSTVSVTNNFVCAKLVNVTGVCRRRRGFLIDDPVILSFDEEIDESIDDVLHPGQFLHTRTLGVEVTPLVQHPGSNLPGTMDVIESSQVEVDTHNIQKRMDHHQMMIHDDDAQSRIYFSQLAANIASAILEAIRPSTVTLITTITVTRSSTMTTFKTTSFFIMGCTPSPLPFATCPDKRSL